MDQFLYERVKSLTLNNKTRERGEEKEGARSQAELRFRVDKDDGARPSDEPVPFPPVAN